jgi:hypothetical protein
MMPQLVLIDTVGLPTEEDHHFNLIGQKLWAQRGIDGLIKAGLAPWASSSGLRSLTQNE